MIYSWKIDVLALSNSIYSKKTEIRFIKCNYCSFFPDIQFIKILWSCCKE